MEEQIEVLRLLWSQAYVTFEGRYHRLDQVGLNRSGLPRIPIWLGTEFGETALRRVARLADGWMPLADPVAHLPRLRQFMREAGRDPSALMVRGPLVVQGNDRTAWRAAARRLQDAGVTHLNIVAPPDITPTEALPKIIEARHALGL
jgi:alkanesulfonate monooxygenase SsuD/methylene tetrahydromethanopterin reductase-like flavin-dependent oxidoreductase (luciferase family)